MTRIERMFTDTPLKYIRANRFDPIIRVLVHFIDARNRRKLCNRPINMTKRHRIHQLINKLVVEVFTLLIFPYLCGSFYNIKALQACCLQPCVRNNLADDILQS